MTINYGPGVSRVLDPTATQYSDVILQQGKPPLDAEFVLLQDLGNQWNRQMVMRGTPSGFLCNETNPRGDFLTSVIWSNWFKFGSQRAGEQTPVMWAVVNGWIVPVTGTRTGSPPSSPDNTDTYNVIALDPPPNNAGDFRIDFVFLEVWQALISPNPSTANKPGASSIYTYGNVEGGMSFLSDDLVDPAIGFETTKRVQVQYRIRVVDGLIGLTSNPDGFDPTVVKAQGAGASPTSYVFSNMRSVLGDPGLWRAGDGTQNALGTVDGYSYAIPICAVFRRNTIPWNGDPAQNLNGGFNRNPTAVDRTGIQTFGTAAMLAADLSATATTATLASAMAIPLPISPATPVLIQIGDELMTYTAITTGTPPQITGITRGTNNSRAELHRSGTPVLVISGRPDGLFSDQIAHTDVLDLRHAVNPNGFDYYALLKGNLDKLLRGQLRANWKRTGAGPQGPFCLYQDKITTGSVSLGVTKLDAFDGIRQIFSDAATPQRIECVVQPNSTALPAPISAPGWQLSIAANQTVRATGAQFSPGDVIQIPVNQLKAGLAAGDADQVRWVFDNPLDLQIRLDGQSYPLVSDHASLAIPYNFIVTGSVPVGASVTNVSPQSSAVMITTSSPHGLRTNQIVSVVGVVGVSAANGYFVVTVENGNQFVLNGTTFSGSYSGGGTVLGPNLGPNDDLIITLGSAFPTILQSSTTGPTQLYITLNALYGPGRGLSRRPDSLHSISFLSPSTDLLLRQIGVPSSDQQTVAMWLPLWQKYRPTAYKRNVPVTAECFADLGSKSIVVSPFRRIAMPTQFVTMDGTVANPYTTTPISSTATSNGSAITDPTVNFLAAGINVGDSLIVTGGPFQGRYFINGGLSVNSLNVGGLPPSGPFPYTIEHITALAASGAGSATGTTFTDGTANFVSAGVVTGDVLLIVSPQFVGKFTVLSLTTTTLTVERQITTTPVSSLSYIVSHAQGNMPLNAANGTTPKWTTTDPLGLFSGVTGSLPSTKNIYVTLPRHLAPGWGALYVPPLWQDESPFAQGINFMSLSVEGSTFTDGDRNYVPYSNGSVSYALFSTLNFSPPPTPATFNAKFIAGGKTYAGMRKFTDTRALGRQGLELPPFYGIARLFAVYEANNYNTAGSAYNATTRAPTGGGAVNLLRQNMSQSDGPAFWVEIDADGDSTFILNANLLDLSRSPTPLTFSSGDFVIEASVFGFDRGSFDITKEFRLVMTNPDGTNGGGSGLNRKQANDATGRYTTGSSTGPNVGAHVAGPVCVLPGPAAQSDQVVINYSRTPYQGDAWGSQTNFIDISQNVGPLTSGTAYQLASTGLNMSGLTRPNQKVFEVLASVGFATTLGTGRISGAPSGRNTNVFDPGFENMAAFPPNSPVAPRPVTLSGAFQTDFIEVGTEYLGATERLPLGSLFRDKDFRGGLFDATLQAPLVYSEVAGVGANPGNLAVSHQIEQSELLLDTSSTATGAPSDLVVHVDGEQTNYALLVNFRTLRGGSLFTASGAHPGGEVSVQTPSLQTPDGNTNALIGEAFLVRNYTTSIGATEVSAGGELMMIVVTNVQRVTDEDNLTMGFVSIGTNGTGEGYAAADFYRIDGHPLIRDNVRVVIDPTIIALSARSK